MKRNIALISGMATGFLVLLVLGHFAGISIEKKDFLVVISLLLISISITLLLTDGKKTKRCDMPRADERSGV